MSLESNKELVQLFFDEVINTGNVHNIAQFIAKGSMLAGGMAGQLQAMRTPFPDMVQTIDEMIAEGDKVVAKVTVNATNSGTMVGMPGFGRLEQPVPPTGRKISQSAVYIFKIKEAKIISFSLELDEVGMLRTLGWTFSPPG